MLSTKSLCCLVLLAALVAPGLAEGIEEPPNSKVHQVTYDRFWRFIEKNPLVLMEFYAPWCGHCQQLAPNYREAAAILADMDLPQPVVFGKYDDSTDSQRQLRGGAPDVFDYQAYPALFVFKNGKHERYLGGREVDDLVWYMQNVAKGLDPEEEEKKLKPGMYKKEADYDETIVKELDTDNFAEVVEADPNAVWIVEFYSDHCPICKTLFPAIKEAGGRFKNEVTGKVRMGAVNMRVNHELGEKYSITSYPWVASFYQGKKVEDMAGLSGAESVVKFGKKQNDNLKPKGGPLTASAPASAPSTKGVEQPIDEKAAAALVYGDGKDSEGSWREILGRHAWYLLHTVGATYPEHPSEADKQGARNLVAALGQLYPCKECRRHLQETLADPGLGPVQVGSREELSMWFCKLHNIVNVRNKKEEFKCDQLTMDLLYLRNCAECKDHHAPGKKHEGVVPWDASLYAKDPESYQDIKSQEEMWEVSETEELFKMAVEYNVLMPKKEKKWRSEMESGTMSREEITRNLFALLRPVMKLQRKIKALENEAKTCKNPSH